MSSTRAALSVCMIALFSMGQTASSKYQTATITAVTAHQSTPSDPDSTIKRYDVSVKIGNTIYVVLYTPPSGVNTVEYTVGMNKLFLVGDTTLTFNSALTGTTAVPILRRETVAGQSSLDLSKAPGQYFSMKLQNLSEALELSDDQQAKIKPALEQESGEVSQILKNPVLTRNEKLERFEKIVRSSDAKIKPVLSAAQLEKLERMRRELKEDVKTLVAQENPVERH